MTDTAPKSIVFDLDGTLIDSAPDIHAAVNRMLSDLGLADLSLREVTGFIGNGLPNLVRLVMEARSIAASDEDRAQQLVVQHLSAHPADLTKPYPGMIEALTSLRDSGYRLGICTNKLHRPSILALDALKLSYLFDVVIGGDTLPVRKPDPKPLHEAFRQLGGQPVLYVGDSEVDAATAENAAIPFGLYLKGYRKTSPEDLTTHFSFEDFSELPGHLARL